MLSNHHAKEAKIERHTPPFAFLFPLPQTPHLSVSASPFPPPSPMIAGPAMQAALPRRGPRLYRPRPHRARRCHPLPRGRPVPPRVTHDRQPGDPRVSVRPLWPRVHTRAVRSRGHAGRAAAHDRAGAGGAAVGGGTRDAREVRFRVIVLFVVASTCLAVTPLVRVVRVLVREVHFHFHRHAMHRGA